MLKNTKRVEIIIKIRVKNCTKKESKFMLFFMGIAFLIYFFIFAPDHPVLQYIIYHCSDSVEQEVSEALLGLWRRPPLLTVNI